MNTLDGGGRLVRALGGGVAAVAAAARWLTAPEPRTRH
jgi:hypothetical protein